MEKILKQSNFYFFFFFPVELFQASVPFSDNAYVFSIGDTRKANCFPEPTFKIWGKLGVGAPVILLSPDSFHWLSGSNVKFWPKEPRVVAEAWGSGRHRGWVRSAVSISVEPSDLNFLSLSFGFTVKLSRNKLLPASLLNEKIHVTPSAQLWNSVMDKSV